MRTAKCLIIVLVLIAAATGTSQEPSNTREASCTVRITADPDVIPLNTGTMRGLINSSAVVGKATREVLGLNNAQKDIRRIIEEGVEIEWLAQDLQRRDPLQPQSRSTGQAVGQAYDPMMQRHMDIYGSMLDQHPAEPSAEEGKSEQAPPTSGRRRRGRSQPEEGTGPVGDDPLLPLGMRMGSGYGMGGYSGMAGAGGMGGGMGGGMMGGMGMGGGMMGGMYAGSASAAPGGTRQAVTLGLSVQLPEDAKPAAEEFLAALVENLREALSGAYQNQFHQLQSLIDLAETRHHEAEDHLNMAMGPRSPEAISISGQLETIVDLSILTPEMPFAEAIDHLRDAVEPPLPIVVMWKELLECCEIEPATPIDMDGLPHVKLKTALRTLIAAASGSPTDISYQIDDDVIVIREEESQTPQPVPIRSSTETDARDLAVQRRDLARRLQQAEMYLTTSEARQRAIEDQIARIRHEAEIMMKEDSITREMQNLIKMSEDHLEVLTLQMKEGRVTSAELAGARENLVQAKISLARRREELSKSAGGGQLDEYNSELSRMAIDTAEKRAEIEILRRYLAETEDKIARASMFDPKAARIRMAQEALNIAETQLTRLRTQLANLQPPTVTLIGAN